MNRINRVVITGMGAVTPIGNNVEDFWQNSKNGNSGIDFIKSMDTSDLEVKVGGEVKDLKLEDYLDKKEIRRLDRFTQYALIATEEAIKDSNLDLENIDSNRFGVMVGSGIGGFHTHESEFGNIHKKGPKKVSPMYIPMAIINAVAANVAIKYNARGICTSAVTACATGTNNIGDAFRHIKHGYADIMLCGASEASFTPIAIAGFNNMRALSTSQNPKRASIPFDKDRNGFVMGEGAGILVLEELEHAKARGAKIYAEFVGYGATSDSYHITSPAPEGEGGARAMKIAMEEGNVKPEEITYINAHGTSTHLNDACETAAIKTALGEENARKVMVSSTKGHTGHLLGAAGGVEAIVCSKAIEEGFAPATINYKVPDEECDLDIVPNQGRKVEIKYAISNSLGFGGHNSSILLKKYEE